jgi:hypothetical protein
MHPKDNEIYQIGTKVIWTRPSHKVSPKVVKAVIVDYGFQKDGKGFLNYYVRIEGEKGNYAAYHSDLEPLTSS